MSGISNNTSNPLALPQTLGVSTPALGAERNTFKAVQDSNSAEEKAIAASTNLSGKLSKGDKRTTAQEESELRRVKLIEKISKIDKLNISENDIDDKVSQLKRQIKDGSVLIKDMLDSEGGETVLTFAALKKMEKEDDGDDLQEAVTGYLDILKLHKSPTIVSWVNTSESIAKSVPDKDLAYEVQSMLASASQISASPRAILKSIVEIGGVERGDLVKRSSIRALSDDIKANASSADIHTLANSISMLSNIHSVSSMIKEADDQLKKLFTGNNIQTISSSDFLEMSLDISMSLDVKALKSYSIAVLGANPESEYKFCDSIRDAFNRFPISVWEDHDERQEAIDYVSRNIYSITDPVQHFESSIMRKIVTKPEAS